MIPEINACIVNVNKKHWLLHEAKFAKKKRFTVSTHTYRIQLDLQHALPAMNH